MKKDKDECDLWSGLDATSGGKHTKQCPWCYEPAVAGTWTPRHGWIDLCQRHYNETSRDVVNFLLHKLEASA